MKHIKKFLVFCLVLMAGIAMTSVMAEAKDLKTVKLSFYEGQSKTIRTPKEIKSIDADTIFYWDSNRYVDLFYGSTEITGKNKFKITIEPELEDCTAGVYPGKYKGEIVVTYTDGSRQKYIATVTLKYAEKVVKELKPLLEDPDKGIRTLAARHCPDDKVMEDGTVYKYRLVRNLEINGGNGVEAVNIISGFYKTQGVDEMLADMTDSQKEAAVLQLYFTNHMAYQYGSFEPGTQTFKALYEGSFKGICGESANMVMEICRMLGYDVRYFRAPTMNMSHGWAGIPVTDAYGRKYWEGIDGSSFACNVLWNYKSEKWVSEEDMDIDLKYDAESYCDIVWDKFWYEPYREQYAAALEENGAGKAASLPYDWVFPFSEGLAKVEKDGRFGYIDKNGKEIVKPKYLYAENFKEGFACVWKDGKWGYIDKNGKEKIKPKYDKAEDFTEGFAAVKKDGKWGFIDKNGKEAVKPEYQKVYDFSEGFAAVEKDGKWGYVNEKGRKIVKPKYEKAEDFSEGLAAVCLEEAGKADWGYIDTKGREIIKPQYFEAKNFSGGLAAVRERDYKDFEWGYVDKKGREVIKPKYSDAYSFSEGLAAVFRNGKGGYIDKKGKEIIKPKYSIAHDFKEGVAKVCKDGKWGYVNNKGKEIVKPEYNLAYDFSEGLAAVKKDGKWGYVDKNGKEIVKPEYRYAFGFSEGLAVVWKDRKCGYIDKTGKVIVKLEYDSTYSFSGFSEGLAVVYKDGRCGYVDKNGREVMMTE